MKFRDLTCNKCIYGFINNYYCRLNNKGEEKWEEGSCGRGQWLIKDPAGDVNICNVINYWIRRGNDFGVWDDEGYEFTKWDNKYFDEGFELLDPRNLEEE